MELYSIGKIAKICGVSIHRLRNYHKRGLIKPQSVDKITGRRYYSALQIFYVNYVDHLRKMNFGLEEIQDILDKRDWNLVRNMYAEKLKIVDNEISQLMKIMKLIKDELTDYEGVHNAVQSANIDEKYNLLLKKLPKRSIISIAGNMKANAEIEISLHNELEKIISKLSLLTIWTPIQIYPEHWQTDNAIEHSIKVAKFIVADTHIKSKNIEELPSGFYITAIVKGKREQIQKSWKAMQEWISENSFSMSGPLIQIYHVNFIHTENEENFISELQVLVEPCN